jgi:hypothetical protein
LEFALAKGSKSDYSHVEETHLHLRVENGVAEFAPACGRAVSIYLHVGERYPFTCMWERFPFTCMWESDFRFTCMWESDIRLPACGNDFRLPARGRANSCYLYVRERFPFPCMWESDFRLRACGRAISVFLHLLPSSIVQCAACVGWALCIRPVNGCRSCAVSPGGLAPTAAAHCSIGNASSGSDDAPPDRCSGIGDEASRDGGNSPQSR